MEAAIITTYRCNARCQMSNTWRFPAKKEEEVRGKSKRFREASEDEVYKYHGGRAFFKGEY